MYLHTLPFLLIYSCEWIRIDRIRIAMLADEYLVSGYVLTGFVLTGYALNGSVWDDASKRFATKRLSGRTYACFREHTTPTIMNSIRSENNMCLCVASLFPQSF